MSACVVMGVSGSGKTSIAALLAERTGGVFLDADDFHSVENKARMAAGLPLSDEDRRPWLDRLNAALRLHASTDARPLFLACSALRARYREQLGAGVPALRFIYLKGSKELVRARLEARPDHFMPAALLDSQFATLEEPTDALVADISLPLPELIDTLLPRL
jgi:gluconokinase